MANIDFTFDGVSAAAKNFLSLRIIKGLMPIQEEVAINIPKVSGITQLFKKFTKRDIIIRGELSGTDHDDLIDKISALSAFLYSSVDKQLIINNDNSRYYNAQHIADVEVLRENYYSMLDLKFTCNDPFAYAITPDTDGPTQRTTDGGTWNITNLGQYYAYGTVTIHFNQAQTHIYISNNTIIGSRFDISKSFVNHDVLVVDAKTMQITLNGTYSPAGFGDGGLGYAEYILLAYTGTGINQFEIGTDDVSLDVTVTVAFNKTYL